MCNLGLSGYRIWSSGGAQASWKVTKKLLENIPERPEKVSDFPGEVLEKKKQLAVSSVTMETNKFYHLTLLSGTNRT